MTRTFKQILVDKWYKNITPIYFDYELIPGKLVVFNGILMHLSSNFENSSIGYYYDQGLQEFSTMQIAIQNGSLNSNATFPQTHSDIDNNYQSRLHAFSGYRNY